MFITKNLFIHEVYIGNKLNTMFALSVVSCTCDLHNS